MTNFFLTNNTDFKKFLLLLSWQDPEHPNKDYLSNHISTTKYTILSFIPKNLFEQFHRQGGPAGI
jgi:hypothetical protein